VPAWGDFAGAPPDFTTPPGGTAEVTPAPGDGAEVVLHRADGTRFAQAHLDTATDRYGDVRYFDPAGRLSLVISRVDAVSGPARPAARALATSCRNVSRDAGWRWTALPIAWRMNTRSVPRRLGVPRTLAAVRAGRGTWGANANRCGVPDRSRLAFAYRGTTARPVGRNGVSSVGLGETSALGGSCVGSVACTLTWTRGARAIESDVRVDRNPRAGLSVAARPGRRIDLRSVILHEAGHTAGLAHVNDRGQVMFPTIRAGTTQRLLGRGDATRNNAKY
jgi:hypothetical protein